jgi:hypothetical protein
MSQFDNSSKQDTEVGQVLDALQPYREAHPVAAIDAYRQNLMSIRVRIIDSGFHGLDLVEREGRVWRILEPLPPAVRSHITLLLLLTPEEAKVSFMNFDFENPLPSRL